MTCPKHKNSVTTSKATKTKRPETWHVSTWSQRAWLTTGCASVLFSLAKSIQLHGLESILLSGFMAYILADLCSGIYHWAIDNYGTSQTPIFGSQIHGFQGHHDQPWAIATKQVANNLYLTAASVASFVIPISMLSSDQTLLAFVGVFGVCQIFSQQIHAWAHTPRRKLPWVVVRLQDAGFLLSPYQHAEHHRQPHNSNYCIVSGMWNGLLDRTDFFLGLELLFYRVFGYTPRSWIRTGPTQIAAIVN